jgi:hypothetical protein
MGVKLVPNTCAIVVITNVAANGGSIRLSPAQPDLTLSKRREDHTGKP